MRCCRLLCPGASAVSFDFGDSFDCYAAIADMANGYWDTATVGSSSLVAGRFAGSRALSLMGSAAVTPLFVKTSSVNDGVHHIVCAFQQTTTLGSSNAAWITLFDGATAQCSIVFKTSGDIVLASGASNGTVLDTYTAAWTTINTWYAFEFEIVVHNSTGSWAVRKNGNTVNDRALGSLDTAGGTANNYANKIGLGNAGNLVNHQFDDLYWRSSAAAGNFLSDIRCYTRAPASDAAVQFSRTPTGVLTQIVPPTVSSTVTSAGVAKYTQFTAAYSGTITGASIAVTTVGTLVNMKCAIYADNAGTPGAILASATAPFTPVVVGSNTFIFSPGVAITKGVSYWVGACADGAGGSYTASGSTQSIGASSTTSYATFPQASPVVSIPVAPVQMSWTFTATPANWQAVSEPQQDATTSYVYDSVPGHADLYGIAAIASTPLTTYAVTTRAYAIKSDAGTRTMAVQLKSGATTDASPTVVLTPSNWQWAWKHYPFDPSTGAAWTATAVNLAQCGPVIVA
jgi:hypothetical protein